MIKTMLIIAVAAWVVAFALPPIIKAITNRKKKNEKKH